MSQQQAPKKKATKGSKQIVEENVATVKFYRNMSLIATGVQFLGFAVYAELSTLAVIMTILSLAAHASSYYFMALISKPKLTEKGDIIETGTDLNIEGGITEHVKDIVILTSGTQLVSILSEYFWLLMLFLPIRAGWLLWQTVGKQFFQKEAAEEGPVNEKKQKKLQRKMNRVRQ
ncbi:transmembrane protein 208 isoform X1 [Anopheles coustani]|uniref:transmembrane protein 208 isoform X1 n=1 Tax=Anopheles coustani TaxID=139045 RepID=UPI00265A61C3|nr:transmembrane protein 208 isoform X1 [Anopheles coustani]